MQEAITKEEKNSSFFICRCRTLPWLMGLFVVWYMQLPDIAAPVTGRKDLSGGSTVHPNKELFGIWGVW
jgi:hypothetical protein